MLSKIVVLGSDGLLGSKIYDELQLIPSLQVIGTSRQDSSKYIFNFTTMKLIRLIRLEQPDYVINCIATTSKTSSLLESLRTNSLLPIHLAILSKFKEFQVIHFGSNAVFSGRGSKNIEYSVSFPQTKYGITKALGDFSCFASFIIRTSFVGDSNSVESPTNLFNQLKNLEDSAIFTIVEDFHWNGVTSDAITKLVKNLIQDEIRFNGLFHFFSSEILLRREMVRLILDRLNKKNVSLMVLRKKRSRNLSLQTKYHQKHLELWRLAGYQKVPSFTTLLADMQISS